MTLYDNLHVVLNKILRIGDTKYHISVLTKISLILFLISTNPHSGSNTSTFGRIKRNLYMVNFYSSFIIGVAKQTPLQD